VTADLLPDQSTASDRSPLFTILVVGRGRAKESFPLCKSPTTFSAPCLFGLSAACSSIWSLPLPFTASVRKGGRKEAHTALRKKLPRTSCPLRFLLRAHSRFFQLVGMEKKDNSVAAVHSSWAKVSKNTTLQKFLKLILDIIRSHLINGTAFKGTKRPRRATCAYILCFSAENKVY